MTTRLIALVDWAATPLGPLETWPQSLKSTVGLVLASGHAMCIAWGPGQTFIYNDAYAPFLGARHPTAMGNAFKEVWSDIWADIAPLVERVFAGETVSFTDMPLVMTRYGYPEDTWWSFSYSPLRDETGAVAGLLNVASDATPRVLAERRLAAERERQRLALQQMPGFVALHSGPQHRYEYVNDAFVEIAGARNFLGRTLREVFPELAGQGFYELIDRVYATGESFASRAMPIKLDRADGERFIDLIYEPIRDDDKKVTGIFVGGYDVTERCRAEARVRGVLDGMDEGFVLLDPDFRILEINAEGLRLEKRPKSEIVGKVHWSVRPNAEDTDLSRKLKQSMAERAPGDFENRYVWPDGREGYFKVRWFPTGDGLAIFYRDATERVKAEAALREMEERLRLATDSAEIGYWDVDPINDALVWPSRVKAMFGISPAAPVSMRDFYQGLHPDDAPATVTAYEAATDPARRALYDVEFRTIGKEDGVIRWVAARGRGVFDEHGRCVRVVGTALDISRQKAAGAALAESQARYRTLFDAIEAGFCVVEVDLASPDGRIDYRVVEANPAFYRQTGFSEQIFGQWLRKAAPELEEHWYEIYGRVARTGEPERFEQGSSALGRWFDVYAFRTNEAGAPRVGILFNDVSARREAEGRLRELNETLEARVRQRTADLEAAHEQLRQSQKLEAMGSLTGGVAHDFNNLLTPIVGVLDMLQRRGLGGEREQRFIAGAMQSAERAKTLVQRLLAFARRQPLQPIAVDVGLLVKNMAGLVSTTTGPQIKTVVDIASGLPPAKADPNQLEMALLNLAVNARDAMPDGGTLRISASAHELAAGEVHGLRAGSYLRLSVADSGVGMDAATIARAVEPFFSTKGVGKGTGLGLSMVHGLASQLGGALTITSNIGLGTNVELWLPQTDDAPEVAAVAAAQEPSGRSGTALLVDDEEFVRLTTADMLGDLGYRVIEAASAEDALALIAAGTAFDLLVTDHLMPGMTGTALARAAREHRASLPVLIVSGYADVEGIAPDLPRLTKPFRKSDLAASLASLLQTN